MSRQQKKVVPREGKSVTLPAPKRAKKSKEKSDE